MKRTIIVEVEVDIEFREDTPLVRQADLASHLGNTGIDTTDQARWLASMDEGITSMSEPRILYRGYKD